MSVLEMKMPSPGESINEVEIATWLVADGDYVELDQPVAEIDSDKATLELPAEKAGTITLLAEEGDVIELDAEEGMLTVLVDEKEFLSRVAATHVPDNDLLGRNLFDVFRNSVDIGSRGASVFKF